MFTNEGKSILKQFGIGTAITAGLIALGVAYNTPCHASDADDLAFGAAVALAYHEKCEPLPRQTFFFVAVAATAAAKADVAAQWASSGISTAVFCAKLRPAVYHMIEVTPH